MHYIKWLKSILIVLSMFCISDLHAQELHFVTASIPPLAPSANKQGYMGRIAREAFRRIGIKISIKSLPGERALINANNGLDDGDLLRIPGMEKLYPNLVRIPEKVMDFEFVAFTLDPHIQIKDLAGLAPYTVAYVTGWKFYEQNVHLAKHITRVRNMRALFKLLKKDRSDIVLAERWQGLWAAKQLGLKVRLLQPPFKVFGMYMYLHKRHAALVPKVSRALVAMKQDGTFQRIIAETLEPVEVK